MSGIRNRPRPPLASTADLLLVLALAAGSVAAMLSPASPGEGAREIEVIARGRVERVVPLSLTGEHRVSGPLGDSVFEIRDGGVAMRSSPCPDGLCVRQGR